MRKFMSEFAVNMVGGPHALVQQEDLTHNSVAGLFADHPCHIYMICRRPRLSIRPEDVTFTSAALEGSLTIQNGPEVQKQRFSVPVSDAEGFTFRSDYPFNTFAITNRAGEICLSGKAAVLAAHFGSSFYQHLAGEVVYVGQAYGTEGSRIAPDRLQSHSTLQKIYADAMRRTPDKEIWIILWSFEPLLVASFDGRTKRYGTSQEEDDEHIETVLWTTVTEQQRINFTEAALIRYFQPEYNTTYKDSFPKPTHTSYSECYELDINSVAVELNTEDSYCMLWSRAVRPRWSHFIMYALHSRCEREAMFDFVSIE
jgi:hypothetical protein